MNDGIGIENVQAPGDAGLNTRPQRPRTHTAPAPSRGRAAAASAATVDDEPEAGPEAGSTYDPNDESGMPLTRRPRRGGADNQFEIPSHLKRSGWDYEWKTMEVLGKPVGASEIIGIREGGWRAVRASDMPELCVPGSDARFIDRDGQRLFTRPMHLTEEARQENTDIARRVMYDKLQAAAATPDSQPKSMPRNVDSNTLEVEIGTYRPPA